MRQKFTKMMAFVVVVVLSFGLVASANFPDVPTDHWAYDAVTKLVDEGLLSGMPDGTFSGAEPMNRYSVAVLVSRLLDRIAAQPASVVEKVIQQPVTVNQPVQPVIEKTIERVIQEPVEVTKIIETEYVEKPVIEKHIVHEFAGLTEAEVAALVDEKLVNVIDDVEDVMNTSENRIFQFTSNRLKTLGNEVATANANADAAVAEVEALKLQVEEADALTSTKLTVLSNDVANLENFADNINETIDDKIANADSTKSVNELKDQLDAQNDKMLSMDKQLRNTRIIAILGLLAGIAGIVVGFVVK
ncbi:MAG: S-layer homology domain-containing protein [Bacillota bacterium]